MAKDGLSRVEEADYPSLIRTILTVIGPGSNVYVEYAWGRTDLASLAVELLSSVRQDSVKLPVLLSYLYYII